LLGTSDGLMRYDPEAPAARRFQRFRVGGSRASNSISTLVDDRRGGLWIGTSDGLYHAARSRNGMDFNLVLRPEAPAHSEPEGTHPVDNVMLDICGALWANAKHSGVYRIRADGTVEHYTAHEGVPYLSGGPMLEDRAGRIWLGTPVGLLSLESRPHPGQPLVRQRFDTRFGRPENSIRDLAETPDGHLWIAGAMGLLELDANRLRRYTRRNGLAQDSLWSLVADRDGNLWVGTGSAGVTRISRSGFTTFDETDGISTDGIRSVRLLATGEVIAIPGPASSSSLRIQQFSAGAHGFQPVRPQFPASIKNFGWGGRQILLRDHLGETWIATHDGLARFPRTAGIAGLDRLRPSRVYTTRDGLLSNNIFSLFEDSRGDIWIGLMFPPQFGMARWIRAQDRMEDLSGDLSGKLPGDTSIAYAEDHFGTVWIGRWPVGPTRFRNGRFQSFAAADGLPKGSVESLYIDRKGAVWGAARRRDLPHRRSGYGAATHRHIRPGERLIDQRGNLPDRRCRRQNAGTFRGVDRLDPSSGEVLHFNTADGLASNLVSDCACDRSGSLWFGTQQGLSRLTHPPERLPAAPPVRIAEVRIADHLVPVSDLGDTQVRVADLPANQNRVLISFAAVNFAGATRYRYRLEGAGREWSETADPTVTYPALPPGNYRFVVQALGAGSAQVSAPAYLTFTILSPLWKRWWFLLLAALALAGCIYALYSFRLRQLLAVERVRMRIATDPHDDIGSALSQIGLLSEAARRQTGNGMPDALARIAAVSRETAASMSDIVWTINPQRDSLGDLSVRIRRFATELFSARDIDCVVVTPAADEDLKLDIDTRRQPLLMAKEAMHNVIRHAGSTQVSIELKHESRWVVFRINDNGAGFDVQASADGHGIASMRSRAEGLGGSMVIASKRGAGTTLEVRIPR
jgi:ligand-binding sensor domain-containing protein/two-component sensor histidine kinase